MKKSFLTLAMAIMVGFFALNVNAEAQGKGYGSKGENSGTNFVDEDGDGVCDYFVDEDGDGVCDHCTGEGDGNKGENKGNGNKGEGSGTNFVDEDGDGVCDYFVDEDGDGVCDHCTGEGDGNKGENKGNGNKGENGKRIRNFNDMDGDGVCDNAEEAVMNSSIDMLSFVDEDGDGVCDNAGQGHGKREFTDEDGDGECDNYSGRGNRGQGGNGQRDFVDEDGDGECDNMNLRPVVSFPYPNPFSETTELSFTLPSDGYVTAAVYDYDGNQIELITEGDLTAGDYSYTFIPENLETGRYLFTVQFGDFFISKPMVYVQ